LSGLVKVLLSFKGNLMQLSQAEQMVNLTLDDVALISPNGKGVQNAKALLDMGPLSLHIKSGSFEAGGSSVQLATEIYSLRENPQGTFTLSSPGLDPFALLENLEEFASVLGKKGSAWRRIKDAMEEFLPRPVLLEEFILALKVQENRLALQNLEFDSLGGTARFRGEMDWPSPSPHFWVEGALERMSLARYLEGFSQRDKFLDGNFFFTGKFQGEGLKDEEILKSLSGQGNFSITNGEWHPLDFSPSLKALEPFRGLPIDSGSTPFHDLQGSWRFHEEKFETEDLLLHSDDYWIEGKGNLSLKGVLNSSLGVYLSRSLTGQVLKAWGQEGEAEGRQLGPVPFLLVGTLTRPEPRIDGRLIEPFLEAVRLRKLRKILRKSFVKNA